MKVKFRLKTQNAVHHKGFTPEDGTASVAREQTGYVEGGAATAPQREVAASPNLSSPAGQLDSRAIGLTAAEVLKTFGGGQIIYQGPVLRCKHCLNGGKVVTAKWPNGDATWTCHFCGRVAG